MKSTHTRQRGQVLIIFVFAAIGLIAITGLAIDGANVFADRRHAQNAADTAALAAALYKANHQKTDSSCYNLSSSPCGSNIQLAALNMADKNGYNNNPADGNSVEVHMPPTTGPYAVNTYGITGTDYVQVIIHSDVNTFFARVLGVGQLHNTVQAVAMAKYRPAHPLFEGSSLVSMAPTGNGCPGEFHIGGTTQVTLNGGGIFVNSDNPCAFNETNCVDLNLIGGAGIQVVGGNNQPAYCAAPDDVPPTTPGTQVQFPPDPIFTTPAECNQTPAAATPLGTGFIELHPGYYSNLPPGNKDYQLSPGVYCVDSVLKITNPKTSFIGDDVLIWYKPGGYFSFQGGTVQLTGRAAGHSYAGFLMYVDSTYQTSPDAQCVINGGSNDNYTGVIYAPNCDVQVNGTSNSLGMSAQIIGYTFKVNGTSGMIFNWSGVPAVTAPEVNWTGLFK